MAIKTTIAAIGLCVAFAGQAQAQTNQGLVIVGNKVVSWPTNGTAKIFKSDWDATMDYFNKAIALNPKDAGAYGGRAHFKEIKGDLDGALNDLSKAIELDPKFSKSYAERAGVKDQKRDLDGALADLNTAIKLETALEPTNYPGMPCSPEMDRWQLDIADYYDSRGRVKIQMGDKEGAWADFNKAIGLNPKSAKTYTARGLMKAAKFDLDDALADYNKAIEIKPDEGYAYYYRGAVRKIKGDLNGAQADFKIASQLNAR